MGTGGFLTRRGLSAALAGVVAGLGGLAATVGGAGPVAAAPLGAEGVIVTVSTSPTTTTVYGTVTLSATVSPSDGGPAPTGSVYFAVTENGVVTDTTSVTCSGQSAQCSVNGNVTTFSLTGSDNLFQPGSGPYSASITAVHSGDATFEATDSAPSSIPVDLYTFPSGRWGMNEQVPNEPEGSAVIGQQVTITTGLPCIQNEPCPTGSVTFYAQPLNGDGSLDGSAYVIGPPDISTGCPNDCGSESITITTGSNGQLGVGSYDLEADYGGDDVYAQQSISMPFTVANPYQITIPLWNMYENVPNMPTGTAVVGQQVTINTNYLPCQPAVPCPTGTVTFLAQPLDLSGNPTGSPYTIGPAGGIPCPDQCSGEQITVTTGSNGQLGAGSYDLESSYSGNDIYAPAMISIPFTVTQPYQVPPGWQMNENVPDTLNGIAAVGQQVTIQTNYMTCLPAIQCPYGTLTFFAQPLSNGNPIGTPYAIGPAGGISCPENCVAQSFTVTAGANGQLGVGLYDLEADYSGDPEFLPTSISTPLTVSAASSIQVGGFNIGGSTSLGFGSSGTLCCGVFGQGGWPAPTGSVTFTATPVGSSTPPLPNGYTWPVTLGVAESNGSGVNYSIPVATGNGVAAGIPELPVGSYTITASYTGDGVYAPQVVTEPLTVHTASTTTALTSTSPPPQLGSSLVFTATVAPGYDTPLVSGGTVTFENSAGGAITGCANVTVVSGIATCSVLSPWESTAKVTAVYNGLSDSQGNLDYAKSTSNSVASNASTVTVALSGSATSAVGAPEALAATVAPASGSALNTFPSGTITFSYTDSAGSGVLGTVTCPQAGATLCSNPSETDATEFGPISSTALPAGDATITATYSGDPNYSGGGTSTQQVDVALNSFATPLTLSTSSSPVVLGHSVALTLADNVSPGAPCPTGTVLFYYQASGGHQVQIGNPLLLGPNNCTYPMTSLATGLKTGEIGAGSYTLTAAYSGDGYYAAASATGSLTVLDPTSLAISAKPTSAAAGQAIALSAVLTPLEQSLPSGMPSGSVTFTGPGLSVAVPLTHSDCSAADVCKVTLATKSLKAGADEVIARYSGGGPYQATVATKPTVVSVLAANGSGTLTVAPSKLTTGQRHIVLAFTYVVATGGVEGGELTIAVPAGWTAPSTKATTAGLVHSTVGKVSVVGRTIEVSGLTLAAGKTVVISFGLASAGGLTAPTHAGSYSFAATERSLALATLTRLAKSPAVNVVT